MQVNGHQLGKGKFTMRLLLTTVLSESNFPLGDSRAHSITLIMVPWEQIVFENLLEEDPAFLERVLIAKTMIHGLRCHCCSPEIITPQIFKQWILVF